MFGLIYWSRWPSRGIPAEINNDLIAASRGTWGRLAALPNCVTSCLKDQAWALMAAPQMARRPIYDVFVLDNFLEVIYIYIYKYYIVHIDPTDAYIKVPLYPKHIFWVCWELMAVSKQYICQKAGNRRLCTGAHPPEEFIHMLLQISNWWAHT